MLDFTLFNPTPPGLYSSWGRNLSELLPCLLQALRMQIKKRRITLEGVTEAVLRDLHVLERDGQKTMRLVSSVLNILLSVFSGRYTACATEGIVKQTINNYTKTELSYPTEVLNCRNKLVISIENLETWVFWDVMLYNWEIDNFVSEVMPLSSG